jgi:HAE1 family hydrophobic/amphiphilic exporter-1
VSPRDFDSEGRLPRFSLDRRITLLVLFLTLVVVGVAATFKIPVELIPAGYDEPFLSVTVPWEDAPSREVLDKVTLPLEEELSSVRGISRQSSYSVIGRSVVYLSFKHGTDMDVAYREVRDRVERARALFPDDIDRVYVSKEDASGIPVFVLGVAVDAAIVDSYNLLQNAVIQPLERIEGVASVSAEGLVEKEVLIELDRERTTAAGLDAYDLAQQLGSDNFTLASGNVRDGSRKLLLRSMARYRSLEEIEDRLVGPTVRLGDIARVSYEQPEKDFRVRAMSKPAFAVLVMKEGDANVREVSRQVSEVVERMKTDPRLRSVEMITLLSQGEVIDEALGTLLHAGLVGGLIAGAVLFLFLRRFRLTFIICLGIPVSLLVGLTVMYFTGETLNLLTLLGLMLCVGMLVDNSVVVAENIHRLHRDGMERREACIHGAGEVALAITMSTMTMMFVFAPVALAEGPAQFFLLRLAIPVCVSVAGSLLVALVFTPLCVFVTLPAAAGGAARTTPLRRVHLGLNAVLRTIYERTFGALNRAYDRWLLWSLARRLDLAVLILLGFVATAALPMQKVKFTDVQEEERSGFEIGVEMPQTNTLEEAEEWFLACEKVVETKKDELGLEGWFLFHRKMFGEINGWFARPRTVDISAAEATKIVMEALPKKPGYKLTVGNDRENADTEAKSTYAVTLNGEDAEELDILAEDLERLLVQIPGVLGLKGGSEQALSELALVVDRSRAEQYGVNPRVIAGVVGAALRGQALPKYHADGKEIPVRVRFEEQDRESLTELAGFGVPTASGGVIPLSALTEARVLPTQRIIAREDKRIGRPIVLELEQGKETEARARLDRVVAAVDLPEGVTFGTPAGQSDFEEDFAGLLYAAALSVVLIYLLMGFLFESFILPLSIILTIPLSLIGVYWTHFAMGYDLDFLGVVAIVLLVGVVVNNGIVLVDYINRQRLRGLERQEAVITATHLRFRPIMMTALTTVMGMFPLAFAGSNSIGLSYTSFSLTLIGGMTSATLLTLLVVPVFYTLFDDARAAFAAAMLRTKRAAGLPAAPAEQDALQA